jgi:hypothetical protein
VNSPCHKFMDSIHEKSDEGCMWIDLNLSKQGHQGDNCVAYTQIIRVGNVGGLS